MKLITKPEVYLVGRQLVQQDELDRFLKDHGVVWSSDSEVGSEVLAETAGRVCYMSFAKPRPGGNKAYLDHIKEVGHGSVLEHAVWNLIVTGVSRSLTHELVRHRAGVSPSQLSQRYVDESVAEFVVPPDLQIEVEAFFCRQDWPDTSDEDLKKMYPRAMALPAGEFHSVADAGGVWLRAVEESQISYCSLSNYLTNKVKKRAYEEYLDRVTDGRDHPPMSFEDWKESKTPENDKTAHRKFARQAARSVLPNATETKVFLTVNARAARNITEQRGSRFADPEIRALAHAVWKVLKADAPNFFSDYEEAPLPDGSTELTTKWRKV